MKRIILGSAQKNGNKRSDAHQMTRWDANIGRSRRSPPCDMGTGYLTSSSRGAEDQSAGNLANIKKRMQVDSHRGGLIAIDEMKLHALVQGGHQLIGMGSILTFYENTCFLNSDRIWAMFGQW